MDVSVLDLFILSQLDRGLQTPYELQTRTGMSLGASVPALERLKKNGLIRREKDSGTGKRRRHLYALTDSGKDKARDWKKYMSHSGPPTDLDSILRLVDIAMHYRGKQADVTRFLERAAQDREALANEAEAKAFRLGERPLSYDAARALCETARLRAEAQALKKLAVVSAGEGKRQAVATRRRKAFSVPDGPMLIP